MKIAPINFKGNGSFVPVTSLGGKQSFINRDKVIYFEESKDGKNTDIFLEGNYMKQVKGTPYENMSLLDINSISNSEKTLNTVI